jgi:hypothetical protein
VRYSVLQRCAGSAAVKHVGCDNIGVCVDSSGDAEQSAYLQYYLRKYCFNVLCPTYVLTLHSSQSRGGFVTIFQALLSYEMNVRTSYLERSNTPDRVDHLSRRKRSSKWLRAWCISKNARRT